MEKDSSLPAPNLQDSTLSQMFAAAPPSVSFEFFPPKTPQMEEALWSSVTRLAPLNPAFVSVTYGAGGTTRERTHQTVRRILDQTSLTPAAHLTCVGAARSEIDEIARDYWQAGVRHIVALRGDPPVGADRYQPHPQGYAYAADLVAGLRRIGEFEISVAAFPEKHPEAPTLEEDIDHLKRKLDAGATRAISQYFFDVEHFLRFRDMARARGITAPIVPGIVPIANFQQIVRFSAMCGAGVPHWLHTLFEGLEEDQQTHAMIGASVAAQQCQILRRHGENQFHFYTLNRAPLTLAVCHMLGLRPSAEQLFS